MLTRHGIAEPWKLTPEAVELFVDAADRAELDDRLERISDARIAQATLEDYRKSFGELERQDKRINTPRRRKPAKRKGW